MSLAAAVKGGRYTAQQITWSDADGNAKDLSGATLGGTIQTEAGVTRAIDGTLTPDPDQSANPGLFTWSYGANDVAGAGVFTVQFSADYGSNADLSLPEQWQVVAAQEVA